MNTTLNSMCRTVVLAVHLAGTLVPLVQITSTIIGGSDGTLRHTQPHPPIPTELVEAGDRQALVVTSLSILIKADTYPASMQPMDQA